MNGHKEGCRAHSSPSELRGLSVSKPVQPWGVAWRKLGAQSYPQGWEPVPVFFLGGARVLLRPDQGYLPFPTL